MFAKGSQNPTLHTVTVFQGEQCSVIVLSKPLRRSHIQPIDGNN